MLPSRPNAGLPSGPRSRSIGRPTREEEPSHRYDRAHSRGPFISTRDRSRPRAPPLPDLRYKHAPQSRSYDSAASEPSSDTSSYRRSPDSESSSGSSFFERIRNGAAGYASSLTSFEDDDRGGKSSPDSEDSARGRSLRTRRMAKAESPISPDIGPDSPSSAASTGDGYRIWTRVATAASELTVSVSKAWTANIATYTGEETPPGSESRLTRGMKAYHLEKARSPADLPAWLFNERERRPAPKAPAAVTPTSRRRVGEGTQKPATYDSDDREPVRPRGLRDIYDAAASNTTATPKFSARRVEEMPQPSKSTDRLKALRDAKRNALTGSSRQEEGSRREEIAEQQPERRVQQQTRVGLPAGPMPRNRRF